MKKFWNVFTSILVVLVVILAVALVGVRFFGVRTFAVLSGSMEPTYHTGSLIYVKEVDPYALETGDVITFMIDEDTVVTHRIAGVVPDEEDPNVIRFRTKGDANAIEDATLVHYQNVVGSPVFTIPYLGYLINYIQHPPGTYVSIVFAILLLMLIFIPDLFDDEKSKKKKGKAQEDPETEDSDAEPTPLTKKQAKKQAKQEAKAQAERERLEKLQAKEDAKQAKRAAKRKKTPESKPAAPERPQKTAPEREPAAVAASAVPDAPTTKFDPIVTPLPAAKVEPPVRKPKQPAVPNLNPRAEDFDFEALYADIKRDLGIED